MNADRIFEEDATTYTAERSTIHVKKAAAPQRIQHDLGGGDASSSAGR
jgi:hypothetical protein